MVTVAQYLAVSSGPFSDSFAEDRRVLYTRRRGFVKRSESAPTSMPRGTNLLEKGLNWITNYVPFYDIPKSELKGNTVGQYVASNIYGKKDVQSQWTDWIAQAPNEKSLKLRSVFAPYKNPQMYAVMMSNVRAGNTALANHYSYLGSLFQESAPQMAQKYFSAAKSLYEQADKKSHFFGNVTAGNYLQSSSAEELETLKNMYPEEWRQMEQYWSDENVLNAANQDYYNKIYKPQVEDKELDDNFYGWFSDPGWAGAARYATPWLTYGIPLAAVGSMMGTNALWTPAVLGGLGMGLYGYATGNGYLKDFRDSAFGQFLDTLHSGANIPIANLWNGIEPGTGRAVKKILTGKQSIAPPESESPVPENNPAPEMITPNVVYTQSDKSTTPLGTSPSASKNGDWGLGTGD